jgi:hypothetical protein
MRMAIVLKEIRRFDDFISALPGIDRHQRHRRTFAEPAALHPITIVREIIFAIRPGANDGSPFHFLRNRAQRQRQPRRAVGKLQRRRDINISQPLELIGDAVIHIA